MLTAATSEDVPRFSLPQELTDMVLDFLHDDKKSLKSCALVCRPWLRVSHYHLFREYRVDGTASVKGGYTAQLRALLQQSFFIHIRELTLVPIPSRSALYPELSEEDVAAFLTSLPQLRVLKLNQTGFTRRTPVLGLPTTRYKLDKLTVNWMYPSIPGCSSSTTDFLSLFHEVRELDLRVIHRKHLSNASAMDTTEPIPTLAVQTLSLSDVSAPLLSLLRTTLLGEHLRSIKACVAAVSDVAELGSLLAYVGWNLVEFQLSIWNFWSNDYTDWHVLGLSNCPNLTSIVILYANSGPFYSWETVYALLAAVPTTVQDITIIVRDEYCFDTANWQLLQEALDLFPHLRHVQFRKCRGGDLFQSRELEKKTTLRLWRALPTLKKRGALR